MNKQDWLLDDIKNFFEDYLKKQRSLSPNTILAYRDTLRLLIYFSEKHLRKTHLKFTVDDLTLDLILAFLDHIENVRQNSTKTRNSRLAALKTFFTFLAHQHPLQSSQFQRIIAIPTKKSLKTPPHYLQTDQVQTLLQSIGRKSFLDRRDYCLILLLYSTGARASEICNLTVDNIRFESPMMISLLGKGQKIRQIPLCKETLFALKDYMIEQEIIQYIFFQKRGPFKSIHSQTNHSKTG
jgi:integrase/recombinase XerD